MIIRRKPSTVPDAPELPPLEPVHGPPSVRPGIRKSWNRFRLRNEVESEFRAQGARVWREVD